ncbi:hypothetical protein ACFVAF_34540 [Streptomyces sp. NPDC057596]|uniref:hypothetical protein n=1 Tax=unclassified Streptomyces TaxID=2593676 RepID=UPI00341CC6DD
MALSTFGGTPADVLTDAAGNVIPDYPVLVRVAGTGELITALYEMDGSPIGQLRSNPATSVQPGAIRPFQCDAIAIEYEYLSKTGTPLRWYQQGRELGTSAVEMAQAALDREYTAADVGAIPASQRGAANGVATLDPNGLLTTDQMPATQGQIIGESGRRYRIISGTIRNLGDSNGWQLISDSAHRSSGIVAVNTLSDRIELKHPIGAIRVSSMQVTPDETFGARGLRVGASVGLDSSTLFLYDQSPDFITDRVYYDGASSSWKSENGVFTGFAFSGGILTLTHADMGTVRQSAALAGRGGLGAFVGNLAATTTQVVFYSGSFGSLTAVTSPATTMNVYVTRFGKRGVPASAPSSITSSTGNIWITAVAEI